MFMFMSANSSVLTGLCVGSPKAHSS